MWAQRLRSFLKQGKLIKAKDAIPHSHQLDSIWILRQCPDKKSVGLR